MHDSILLVFSIVIEFIRQNKLLAMMRFSYFVVASREISILSILQGIKGCSFFQMIVDAQIYFTVFSVALHGVCVITVS